MDWGERYRIAHTPWDLGRPHPALVRAIEAGDLRPPRPGARALVPGCGRGHDALALAEAGWTVLAADLVPELEADLAPRLAEHGGTFVAGDALALEPDEPFELFWEHTFFCAIDPGERAAYGALAARTVAPGGRLAALLFPLDRPDERGGPPWRVDERLLEAALGDAFARESLGPEVSDTLGREWKERLAVYRRVE